MGTVYYFGLNETKDWNGANEFCKSVNASLLKIDDEFEYARIKFVMSKFAGG